LIRGRKIFGFGFRAFGFSFRLNFDSASLAFGNPSSRSSPRSVAIPANQPQGESSLNGPVTMRALDFDHVDFWRPRG
jgi:hypothetical protein